MTRKPTIKQAAALIGVGRARMYQLVAKYKLAVDTDPVTGWLVISKTELKKIEGRKNGRPKKGKGDGR